MIFYQGNVLFEQFIVNVVGLLVIEKEGGYKAEFVEMCG
jgi:hypothetical protein